jgi:hypothetical protein
MTRLGLKAENKRKKEEEDNRKSEKSGAARCKRKGECLFVGFASRCDRYRNSNFANLALVSC